MQNATVWMQTAINKKPPPNKMRRVVCYFRIF